MAYQMLRGLLDELKKMNELEIVDGAVDVDYKIGALLSKKHNKKPMLFNNIRQYNMRAVGGLFGDRDLLFKCGHYTNEDRIEKLINAVVNTAPYQLDESGPIFENQITKNIDIPKLIPATKYNEKDSGRFITAGVIVVKDPDTGFHNMAVRRLQVNGGNQLSVLISTDKMKKDFADFEKADKDMEVAIILGYDIYFLLASQYSSKLYGQDKYRIDSALRGEPLKLVRSKTKDLLIPADCEIVLEGKLRAGKREYEGPFGELMGYYGSKELQPIIEVDSILYRNNPIYQVAYPCREEHLANGLIRDIEIYSNLINVVDVKDVYVTEGGGYRFNAIVSLSNPKPGDAKMAIITALGTHRDLKQVIIVDDDVNIYDNKDIEWAVTTRSQASHDFIIIPNATGSTLDPSFLINQVTDKFGIDATKPQGQLNERFERARIPNYESYTL